MEVVYKNTDVPQEQRDFTAEVQEIKDAGADGLYTGMDTLQNTGITEALNQAGVDMKAVIFPGGYDDRVLGLPGIEGVYFGVESVPFELDPPAFVEYKKYMQQLDPEQHFAGQVPYYGWLAADAFIEGIKAAGVELPDPRGVHQQPPPRRRTTTRTVRSCRSTSPRSSGDPSTACTTCTWRTVPSCRSSTASRSARRP